VTLLVISSQHSAVCFTKSKVAWFFSPSPFPSAGVSPGRLTLRLFSEFNLPTTLHSFTKIFYVFGPFMFHTSPLPPLFRQSNCLQSWCFQTFLSVFAQFGDVAAFKCVLSIFPLFGCSLLLCFPCLTAKSYERRRFGCPPSTFVSFPRTTLLTQYVFKECTAFLLASTPFPPLSVFTFRPLPLQRPCATERAMKHKASRRPPSVSLNLTPSLTRHFREVPFFLCLISSIDSIFRYDERGTPGRLCPCFPHLRSLISPSVFLYHF